MGTPALACLATLLAALAALAVGPRPPGPPAVARLIERLGSDDHDARRAAMKQLEALGEGVVPALRKAVHLGG